MALLLGLRLAAARVAAPAGTITFDAPEAPEVGAETVLEFDLTGDVTRVDVWVGAECVEIIREAPYTYAWTPAEAGSVVLTAYGRTTGGALVDLATHAVSVTAEGAPTIEIECADPLYIEDTSVTLSAAASDPIDSVQFGYDVGAGEVAIGTDSEEPYTIPWPITQTPGTATLIAHGYYGLVELVSDEVDVTVRSRKADLLAALGEILVAPIAWDPRYNVALRDGTGGDAGKVFLTSWTDLSGTHQMLAPSEARQFEYRATAWNGHPAAYGDAARTTYMVCSDAALTSDLTGEDADCVIALALGGGAADTVPLCLGGASGTVRIQLSLAATTARPAYYRSSTAVTTSTSSTLQRFLLGKNVGTSCEVWRNDTRIGGPTTVDVAAQAVTKLTIGAFNCSTQGYYHTGDIAQVIRATGFQSGKTPADLAALLASEGYIAGT